MAILQMLEGLRVCVTVDGIDLTEYHASSDVDLGDQSPIALLKRAASSYSYVEALSGKAFTIKLHAEHPFTVDCDVLRFEIVVDGKVMSRTLLPKTHYEGGGRAWDAVVAGPLKVVDGKAISRPMVFAELGRTSEDTFNSLLREQAKALKHMDEIVVLVTCRSYKAVERTGNSSVFSPAAEATTAKGGHPSQNSSAAPMYHEKVLIKESLSHTMVLGPSAPIEKGKPKKCETVAAEGPDTFLAKFVFMYRGRKDLQDLLVIDRSPSPKLTQAGGVGRGKGNPQVARQTSAPPLVRSEAQKKIDKKENLLKQQMEIERQLRECSIQPEDDVESTGTIEEDPEAALMDPVVKAGNVPTSTSPIKRERQDDDDHYAVAPCQPTKKAKTKLKVPTIIEIPDDEEIIEVE